MKSFDEIREYINSLSEIQINEDTLYLLKSEIGHRKSMIINDVNINKKCQMTLPSNASKYLEIIFREIQVLEKAKVRVEKMIRGE